MKKASRTRAEAHTRIWGYIREYDPFLVMGYLLCSILIVLLKMRDSRNF